MPDRILVVDDKPDQCLAFELMLGALGYEVDATTDPAEALDLVQARPYQAVLTDLEMPSMSGLSLCEALTNLRPHLPVLVVTAYASLENVAAAFRAGAQDYLRKPVDERQLTLRLTRALRDGDIRVELARIEQVDFDADPHALRGRSIELRQLQQTLRRVGPSESSVLIVGETGSGKERVARELHALSPRARGPFVAVNCAAIPEGLLEDELFGHVRGAFTDASQDRQGLFAAAHGGTLLLDEIAELPVPMQSKLLRVLQERRVRPIGAAHEVEVDVRVLAATHRHLESEIEAGRFRQDLYYRIQVVQVVVPPLRERAADILELAAFFIHRFAKRHGRLAPRLSRQAAEALMAYDFPGNVRELENALERACAIHRHGFITADDLPETMRAAAARERGMLDALPTLQEHQRGHVQRVMSMVDGNKSRASQLLHVDRRTIERKMRPKDGTAADDAPEALHDGESN